MTKSIIIKLRHNVDICQNVGVFFVSKMSMNVQRIPVRMVEIVLMELIHTVVHALLDTLDLTVKQVMGFLKPL